MRDVRSKPYRSNRGGESEDEEEGAVRTTRMVLALVDIPCELVGEVACAGAVAEASDIERRATSRTHVDWCLCDLSENEKWRKWWIKY